MDTLSLSPSLVQTLSQLIWAIWGQVKQHLLRSKLTIFIIVLTARYSRSVHFCTQEWSPNLLSLTTLWPIGAASLVLLLWCLTKTHLQSSSEIGGKQILFIKLIAQTTRDNLWQRTKTLIPYLSTRSLRTPVFYRKQLRGSTTLWHCDDTQK